MENNINPEKFHSSGLYLPFPFYKTRKINFDNEKLKRSASYNVDLLVEFWRDKEVIKKANLSKEKEKEIIDKLFREQLVYQIYWKPLLFEEREALECGLTPFYFRKQGLLTFPPFIFDRIADYFPRLHAYQLLTSHTIDPECSFFINKKSYFENMVSKDIVDRMEKILYEDKMEE